MCAGGAHVPAGSRRTSRTRRRRFGAKRTSRPRVSEGGCVVRGIGPRCRDDPCVVVEAPRDGIRSTEGGCDKCSSIAIRSTCRTLSAHASQLNRVFVSQPSLATGTVASTPRCTRARPAPAPPTVRGSSPWDGCARQDDFPPRLAVLLDLDASPDLPEPSAGTTSRRPESRARPSRLWQALLRHMAVEFGPAGVGLHDGQRVPPREVVAPELVVNPPNELVILGRVDRPPMRG